MKHFILSFRHLMLLAIIFFSITASAYDFEVDGMYYNIVSATDLTCEVTSGDNKYTGEVVIPSTVTYKNRNLTVTSIGKEAFNNSKITKVTIPSSVTAIGEEAFYGCKDLTLVVIPNSVTSIGDGAFALCVTLTSLTIPNSVTKIGRSFISGCSNVKSIIIPNSITSIAKETFCGAGLTNVTIPNSVKSIGESAFERCDSLTDVVIAGSVTSIGNYAFFGCKKLTHLCFEAGDEQIKLGQNKNRGIFFTDDMKVPVKTLYLGRNLPYSSKSDGFNPFSESNICTYFNKVTIGEKINSARCLGWCPTDSLIIEESLSNNTEFFCFSTLSPNKYLFLGRNSNVQVEAGSTIIGENVTNIKASKKIPDTAVIRCLCATPPTVSDEFSDAAYLHATLIVPKGALAAYQSADVWKNFWNIQETETTGIQKIETTKQTPTAIYDLQGRKLTKPKKGINIINGKKVLVK